MAPLPHERDPQDHVTDPHVTGPHVTGKGFVLCAIVIAAVVALLAVFDDTAWIDRHEAASRRTIEVAP